MFERVVFLIIGAIFSFFLPRLIRKFLDFCTIRKRLERNEYLRNNKLFTWLVRYHEYQQKNYGIKNELPVCEIGGCSQIVPYLSKTEWDPPDKLSELRKFDCYEDEILHYDNE
ncbi:MAG: hypothetical protein ACFFDN_49265, partial [Candidatus Hodarchaeota archaeon]